MNYNIFFRRLEFQFVSLSCQCLFIYTIFIFGIYCAFHGALTKVYLQFRSDFYITLFSVIRRMVVHVRDTFIIYRFYMFKITRLVNDYKSKVHVYLAFQMHM